MEPGTRASAQPAQADEAEERPDDGYRLLGARLQVLRKMRRLSLREVAEAVNLSPSFLSLVERGQTDLSLSRFSRLTEFYGVHPSELLIEMGAGFREPEILDVAGARIIDRGEGVEYRVLREDHPQIVMARIAPGARFEDLRAHQGEDYWVVLEGDVQLEYGGKRYPVVRGQTARFSGTLPHGFANVGRKAAVLLALCSVPYW